MPPSAASTALVVGSPGRDFVRAVAEGRMQDLFAIARYTRTGLGHVTSYVAGSAVVDRMPLARPVASIVRSAVGIPVGFVVGVVAGAVGAARDVFQRNDVAGAMREDVRETMRDGVGGLVGVMCGAAQGAGGGLTDVRTRNGIGGRARHFTASAAKEFTGAARGVLQGVGVAPSEYLSSFRQRRQEWFTEEQTRTMRELEGAIDTLSERQQDFSRRAEEYLQLALEHRRAGRTKQACLAMSCCKRAEEMAAWVVEQSYRLTTALMEMSRAAVQEVVADTYKSAADYLNAANKAAEALNPEAVADDLRDAIAENAELADALGGVETYDEAELEEELEELAAEAAPAAAAAPAAQAAAAAGPAAGRTAVYDCD
eukprot:TRINITY_DN6804_c0_g1_i1.p1 TRINITY_DN6804_c0_g1~~TRINITY_DN6804_c0_g1_i1.p1  ORF type:complete len:393 (+),score=120.90 TRINITY_DN6804_c0_g1_i1:69-1181(+)